MWLLHPFDWVLVISSHIYCSIFFLFTFRCWTLPSNLCCFYVPYIKTLHRLYFQLIKSAILPYLTFWLQLSYLFLTTRLPYTDFELLFCVFCFGFAHLSASSLDSSAIIGESILDWSFYDKLSQSMLLSLGWAQLLCHQSLIYPFCKSAKGLHVLTHNCCYTFKAKMVADFLLLYSLQTLWVFSEWTKYFSYKRYWMGISVFCDGRMSPAIVFLP